MIDPGTSDEHVSDKFGRDGRSGLVFLVLARVREVRTVLGAKASRTCMNQHFLRGKVGVGGSQATVDSA